MKRFLIFLFCCIVIISISQINLSAQAQLEHPAETVKTDVKTEIKNDSEEEKAKTDKVTEIIIKGTRLRKEDAAQTHTQSTVDKDMIDQLAGAAQKNPFKALDMLPSVHSESSDAVGLLNDQNNVRIRGQYGDTFSKSSRTIEGLPIGANVGSGFFGSPIDLDDISQISLIRGPVPPDKGFGFGNFAGATDQSFMQPSSNSPIIFNQSWGSNRFDRSFGRVDSGELPTKTRLFVSGSTTETDKWRGPGTGKRNNGTIGISQTLPADIKISFFGAYNTLEQHAYRPLSYLQTQDKSYYRGYDFNANLTGNSLQDKYYYNFNRQKFDEYLGMLLMEYKPTKDSYLTFKPYYYLADGYRLSYNSSGTTDNTIQRNNIEQEQYGFLSEYGINIGPTLAKVGYWYQSMDTMPPSKDQKKYDINTTDHNLTFNSWQYITKVGNRESHSPYLMLNNRLGNLRVDTGIKYIRISLPSVTGYKTAGVPDVSYDDVFNYTTPIDGMHAKSKNMDAWLPYAGLNYEINQQINTRLTYGRNYASPWLGGIYSTYYSDYIKSDPNSKFRNAGISLQDLWDDMKLETSNNFDLGISYHSGTWYLAPTLFYSRIYNKQVPDVFDPVVGLAYYQNKAKAESKGAEVEAGVTPVSGFTTFGSVSYNRVTFRENITTTGGATIDCKGKQVSDVPELMGKIGIKYTIRGFSVSPLIRYLGKRYSDCENKEKVDAYTLVDLNFSYIMNNIWRFEEVTFYLNFVNLFNKKYISIIHNWQDSPRQASGIDYMPGAPFTIIGGAKIRI
ncbi:MAG: TonB-dependent receptor [Spirochaetota bacterium]